MSLRDNGHILVIPSWYPENNFDVTGSFFREQAISLQKRGNKVGVIAPIIYSLREWRLLFSKSYGLSKTIDEDVVTYRWFCINSTPKITAINQKRWINLGLKLFDEYIKENGRPDIIHVHSLLNAGFVAKEIKIKYGIPYVVTEHSSIFFRKSYLKKEIKKLGSVISNSSKNIAVSNEFKDSLNKKFDIETWSYLPNIVNEIFISSPLDSISKENECFTFICVCILSEIKRVDFLLKAFAKVFEENNNVKLKIGGDGPLKENLIKLTKELRIEDNVEFLGSLDRKEVLKNISASDALVLSSEYETFGVVLIEALALGKPIIATKCGGPESIVTPDVGYLVEKYSIETFSDAMKQLIARKISFSSKEIRKYCIDNFSEHIVMDKLEKIYQSAIMGSRNE